MRAARSRRLSSDGVITSSAWGGRLVARTGTPQRRAGMRGAMRETLEMINQMQTDGVIDEYAIGGAVGATFYLEPSAAEHVDIFAMLPTISGSSLLSLSPIHDYLRARRCVVQGERILIGDWPVQFLRPHNALEREALAEAVETDVEDVRTRVMTAEHLVAMALETGRAKDYARIVQFLEEAAVDT